MDQKPSPEMSSLPVERERRVVHAPADPQPQELPPEEGQPHVPHGAEQGEAASPTAH